MKTIKIIALFYLLLLSGGFTFAQSGGGCYAAQVIAPPQPLGLGQPSPGAIVRVCSSTATGTPCSPLTPGGLFSDTTLLTPISNPFTADQNGNYNFCASNGNYLVQTFPQTGTTYSFVVTVGIAPSGSYTFSGNNVFTGTNQFSGIELSDTLCTGSLAGFSVLCATSSGPEVSINGAGFLFMPTIAGDIGGTSASPTVTSAHITGGTVNTMARFNASSNLVPSACTDNGSTVACTEPISSTGDMSGATGTFSGSVTAGSVQGSVSPNAFTDVAISAAITATPDGGELYLPAGTYVLSGASLPFTISKRITIRGAGWDTVLQVGAGVGATTDVFLLKPSTVNDVQGMRLQDFYITPASGAPGRSAFMVDGTNASVSNLVIDHVRVDTLGNYAFNTQNMTGTNSSVNGSPYVLKITNSLISGGMNLTLVGDTVNIEGNTFTGPRDITVKQIGAAGTNGGAHGFRCVGNNITVTGGSVIQNAWQGIWGWNDMESPNTSTETNSALLDLQGNASANVQGFQIVGNFLGGSAPQVSTSLRIDRATGTVVRDNFIPQATTGAVVTANAANTAFMLNTHAPNNPLSSWLSDSGTKTWGMEYDQATSLMNFFGAANAYATTVGTKGVVVNSASVTINPTNGIFAASSGDPSSTGVDTAMWRAGANSWAFGNAFGDVSGNQIYRYTQLVENAAPSGIAGRDLIYADSTAHRLSMKNNNGSAVTVGTTPLYNASGTEQVGAPHIVQDTCTLGTNCGVTLSGSAAYTNATSYTCTCQDETAIVSCKVAQTSGSAFTITGTGTDVIRYSCAGN